MRVRVFVLTGTNAAFSQVTDSIRPGKDGRSCSRKKKIPQYISLTAMTVDESVTEHVLQRSHDYYGPISLVYSQFSKLRSPDAVKKNVLVCLRPSSD